jgi:hypothetical protein
VQTVREETRLKIVYNGQDVTPTFEAPLAVWEHISSRNHVSFSASNLSTKIAFTPGNHLDIYNETPRPWWKRLLRIKPQRTCVFAGIIVDITIGRDGQSFTAISWSDWFLEHTLPPTLGQQVVQKAGLPSHLRDAIYQTDPSEDKG